jgi:ketohexokinase
MTTLLVIGACYLDTILTVPYYPTEDEKLRATDLTHRRGGNGPNTLEVLSQLLPLQLLAQPQSSSSSPSPSPFPYPPKPVSLALCSVLPSQHSPATAQIASSLGPNVDLSTCIHREECTEAASSYIIRSSDTGSRTIVNYNGLPEMTLDEFRIVCGKLPSEHEHKGESLWFHFEGRIPDITLQCINHLRREFSDAKVSVEVEKPRRVGLEELASEADVVFYSQSWAKVGALLHYTTLRVWLSDGM